MRFEQKDIVLIPYPFTDQKGVKIRPAIIVSNNIFNMKCQDCIAVPLTSVIKNESYSLIINQDDLESGRLIRQSRARIDKLFAVNKSLITRSVGKINDETFSRIRKELNEIF